MGSLIFLLAYMVTPAWGAPVDWVNPWIGTGLSTSGPQKGTPGGGKGGATTPSAVAPFGMIQWGPDTDHPETSGYNYDDHRIKGFSLTHLSGPGCSNSGDLPLLPFSGSGMWGPVEFSHADEAAAPGKYRVRLKNGIAVELTASERTGMGRFTFPEKSGFGIMLNTAVNSVGATNGQIRVIDATHLAGTVTGGNFCGMGNVYQLHFAIEFDQPFASRSFKSGIETLTFAPSDNPVLKMKIGLSYVSEQNARLNLARENPDWDWERLEQETAQKWSSVLGKIQFGESVIDANGKAVFYTALYHSLLHPNIASDANGDYVGFDGAVHSSGNRRFYANFSGWDIYRSQVQLLALLVPGVASDIAQSLVESATQCGALPKWSQNNSDTGVMPGDPGPLILANLHAFGAGNFDAAQALALMRRNALDPSASCNGHEIRFGADDYAKLGFLPETANDQLSASITLEYAAADFAIARFAKSANDLGLYDALFVRSGSWLNLWDPSSRHIRPKTANGMWLSPFDPASGLGFTEGNSEQYSWLVPYDLGGVVARMGGDLEAQKRLDRFFEKLNVGGESPYLYIGNEPGFGTPWVYLWAHDPGGAQRAIRKIQSQAFANAPGGLPGNDDLGALSSWYVWATLGLYPEVPGVGGLAVSGPVYSDIRVELENGHQLEIRAPQMESQPNIAGLFVNGAEHKRTWIEWDDLKGGARLDFTTSSLPTAWGTKAGDEPPSFPVGTAAP